MFTAALFTIARIWKQLKCPSTDEWMKKWDIHTMDYYSAVRKNNMHGLRVHYVKWKMSDGERQLLHKFAYMWNPKKTKYRNKQNRSKLIGKRTDGWQMGRVVGRMGKMVKWWQIASYKNSPRDVEYSIGNAVSTSTRLTGVFTPLSCVTLVKSLNLHWFSYILNTSPDNSRLNFSRKGRNPRAK